MNEYVKIKLDTYNKFKEIERNERLNEPVELLQGIVLTKRLLNMKIAPQVKLW